MAMEIVVEEKAPATTPKGSRMVSLIIGVLFMTFFVVVGAAIWALYARAHPVALTLQGFVWEVAPERMVNVSVVRVTYDEATDTGLITLKMSPWKYVELTITRQDYFMIQIGRPYSLDTLIEEESLQSVWREIMLQPGRLHLFYEAEPETTVFCLVPQAQDLGSNTISYQHATEQYEGQYVRGEWQVLCGRSVVTLSDGNWFDVVDVRNLDQWGNEVQSHQIDGFAHFEFGDMLFIFDVPRNEQVDGLAIAMAENLWANNFTRTRGSPGIRPQGLLSSCGWLRTNWFVAGLTLEEVQKLCPGLMGQLRYEDQLKTMLWVVSDTTPAVLNLVLAEEVRTTIPLVLKQQYDYDGLDFRLTGEKCHDSEGWAIGPYNGLVLFFTAVSYGKETSAEFCAPHGSFFTIGPRFQFLFSDEGNFYRGDYNLTFQVP